MKKTLIVLNYVFIATSCLALLYVSILGIINPRSVMALVHVSLDNADAVSSIRGVYGGVGLFLTGLFCFEASRNPRRCLLLFFFFWAAYALSRVLTMLFEGPLGSFGNQWLVIESTFAVTALVLYFLANPLQRKTC